MTSNIDSLDKKIDRKPRTLKQALTLKPAFGAACNQCGYCCMEEPCELAKQYLHQEKGPCIALEWENGKAFCGLVRKPVVYLFNANASEKAQKLDPNAESAVQANPELSAKLSSGFAGILRLGSGCDAQDG